MGAEVRSVLINYLKNIEAFEEQRNFLSHLLSDQ
nr:MAG TPA: hypothetical protein [Crassvirales sp.]DAL80374.1 MAG TPA: hypothetical protein [Caudoviricetes sp.]DAR45851.1 MAG TPA: hypothetical protein [Bacteriophage sp.]